jgi:hypothetical protein
MQVTFDSPASDALLSPCAKYRYWLTRTWDDATEPVVFVMLNPSTADAFADDRTIHRCIGFAKVWGHGGIVVVNLFAWRSTDPQGLLLAADPVGERNDAEIEAACLSRRVIVAWGGNAAAYPSRANKVLKSIRRTAQRVECLGKTKDGYPLHPSRLRAGASAEPF